MHESKVAGLKIEARHETLFWRKVEKMGETGCWLWRGAHSTDQYGAVSIPLVGVLLSTGRQKQKALRAHRLSWRLTRGEWPPEFMPGTTTPAVLRHTCDVRDCVNPSHLILGTHAENSADIVARGRSRLGKVLNPENIARGSSVGTSKLTELEVAVIKGEIAAAPRNALGLPARGVLARLAEHFKVSTQMVYLISKGDWWGHVQPAVIEVSILPARLNRSMSNVKLTPEQVTEIRRRSALGATGRQLAREFNTSESNISAILRGAHWADVVETVIADPAKPLYHDDRPRGEAHHKAKLNAEAVAELRRRAGAGEPWVNLVADYCGRFNVRPAAIYDILNGKTWKGVGLLDS